MKIEVAANNWITLGDASTSFSHANASTKNLITSLEHPDGSLITEHNAKATLIWDSFKER